LNGWIEAIVPILVSDNSMIPKGRPLGALLLFRIVRLDISDDSN